MTQNEFNALYSELIDLVHDIRTAAAWLAWKTWGNVGLTEEAAAAIAFDKLDRIGEITECADVELSSQARNAIKRLARDVAALKPAQGSAVYELLAYVNAF